MKTRKHQAAKSTVLLAVAIAAITTSGSETQSPCTVNQEWIAPTYYGHFKKTELHCDWVPVLRTVRYGEYYTYLSYRHYIYIPKSERKYLCAQQATGYKAILGIKYSTPRFKHAKKGPHTTTALPTLKSYRCDRSLRSANGAGFVHDQWIKRKNRYKVNYCYASQYTPTNPCVTASNTASEDVAPALPTELMHVSMK